MGFSQISFQYAWEHDLSGIKNLALNLGWNLILNLKKKGFFGKSILHFILIPFFMFFLQIFILLSVY